MPSERGLELLGAVQLRHGVVYSVLVQVCFLTDWNCQVHLVRVRQVRVQVVHHIQLQVPVGDHWYRKMHDHRMLYVRVHLCAQDLLEFLYLPLRREPAL